MIRILIFLSFLFTYFSGISQTPVFKDYDFASGDYALYFIDINPQRMFFNTEANELAQKNVSNDFHVSDSLDLFQLKQKWKFEEVSYEYEC